MASFDTEAAFVGRFLTAAENSDTAAWQAMEIVGPGMLQDRTLDERFGHASGRFAVGEPLIQSGDPVDELQYRVIEEGFTTADLSFLATRIRDDWRARRQHELIQSAEIQARDAIASSNGKAKRLAERLSMELLDLFSDSAESGRPKDAKEAIDAEIRAMAADEEPGIAVPYPKLESACGPWMPGDTIGISAFANGGKSTLAANLTRLWIRRGVPVIAYPTEMGQQWLARMLAAESDTRQWLAEKRQWKRADPNEVDNYYQAAQLFRDHPFEIVDRPSISPAEIMASTRVIRRRWKGRTVVVVVDHMHRLEYGDDPNKLVGQATKMLRNFARSDTEGGLILVLLYQPRKPEKDVYGPVAGHHIRGDSTVWTELDIHLAPFRMWVKVDPVGQIVMRDGKPKIAKPNSEGSKLCDSLFFTKIDKRRIGGEGPIVTLNIREASGQIYEAADEQEPR